MLKVIIAGGRTFNNYVLLKEKCNMFLGNVDPKNLTIICGDAEGADLLGEKYANEIGAAVEHYPPDWKKGKSAGILRNKEMGDAADALILFWDGESRGSAHMQKYMQDLGKPVRVVRYRTICEEVKENNGVL